MKRIDRYVVGMFLLVFVLCCAAFIGLYVLFDAFLSKRVQDFQKATQSNMVGTLAAAWLMISYYGLKVPQILQQITPAACLIASGYCMIHMARHNELMALLSSGVSIYRTLTPIFVIIVLITFFAYFNQEILIPLSASRLADLTNMIEEGNIRGTAFAPPKESYRVWFFEYDPADKVMKRVYIWRSDPQERSISITIAKRCVWRDDAWWLEDVTVSRMGQGGSPVERYPSKKWETKLTPEEVKRYSEENKLRAAAMAASVRNFADLWRLCKEFPEDRRLRVMLHSRISFPLANIVLPMIGLPFIVGLEKLRDSRFLGLGLCIVVIAGFYAVVFLSQKFGADGLLPPWLAAWLPIWMVAGVGFLLFDGIKT